MSAAEDAMATRLKIVQPWERSRRNGNVAVPAGLTASPNLTDVDIHGFWKDHAEISYGPMTISCDGKLDDRAFSFSERCSLSQRERDRGFPRKLTCRSYYHCRESCPSPQPSPHGRGRMKRP